MAPEEQLQLGVDAFYSNDIAQVVASLEALRRASAMPWAQDRLEGLLHLKNQQYHEGAKALWSSFQAHSEPQVLYELFITAEPVMEMMSPQNINELIQTKIEVIRQCREKNFMAEWRVQLEWLLGYSLYRNHSPLPELQKFASSWKACLPGERYDDASFGMFQNLDMAFISLGKRFFPFVLALAGMDEDVITANTIVANTSGELNLPGSTGKDTPERYSSERNFTRTAETFFSFLPETQPSWRVLDLGCGPGGIGQKLRDRVGHLTGIDLDEDYIAYAKDKAGYDVTIQSDVVEFLSADRGEYDLITACMLLDYVAGREVIALASKRLAPGGVLVFTFIPGRRETSDIINCHNYYSPDFFVDAAPGLTTLSCDMKPYMWSGGYYVALQRPVI